MDKQAIGGVAVLVLTTTACFTGDAGLPEDDGATDFTTPDLGSNNPSESTSEDDTTSEVDATSEGGTTPKLTHSADVQPLWTLRCTYACHEPGGAVGATLDLSSDAYDNIVDVNSTQVMGGRLIVPGDPQMSYLIAKIEDTHVAFGGSGSPMPPVGQIGLTAEEIQTIKDWVSEGALP